MPKIEGNSWVRRTRRETDVAEPHALDSAERVLRIQVPVVVGGGTGQVQGIPDVG